MAIQHAHPDHLTPEEAAAELGFTAAEFEEADRSDNPPPYVMFADPTRPTFRVYHRQDLRKWVAERAASGA